MGLGQQKLDSDPFWFLANQPSTVQYLGDVSSPSIFNNGATGPRHYQQEYYIGYAQDEWRANPKVTLNYGLRYDYYTPPREANNLQVKFNIDTGVIDPNTTQILQSTKTSFQPRVGVSLVQPRSGIFFAGAEDRHGRLLRAGTGTGARVRRLPQGTGRR